MDFKFDDLEFIVTAANIAGYLEAEEIIVIDSDTQLTQFILDRYLKYRDNEWMSVSYHSYMRDQLIDKFKNKEGDDE